MLGAKFARTSPIDICSLIFIRGQSTGIEDIKFARDPLIIVRITNLLQNKYIAK